MVETKPILFQAKIHWIFICDSNTFTAIGSVGFVPTFIYKRGWYHSDNSISISLFFY